MYSHNDCRKAFGSSQKGFTATTLKRSKTTFNSINLWD